MRRLIAALALAFALATGAAPTAGAIPSPDEIYFDSGLKGGGNPIELGSPVEDIPDGLKGGG